jgi:hypothetical protein
VVEQHPHRDPVLPQLRQDAGQPSGQRVVEAEAPFAGGL